jgi:hypothetical protein
MPLEDTGRLTAATFEIRDTGRHGDRTHDLISRIRAFRAPIIRDSLD